jgi:hypothetical protein
MKYQANIIESEAGWGSKIDEKKYFDSKDERDKFVNDYNEKYNPNLGKAGYPVPDWYMIAQAID